MITPDKLAASGTEDGIQQALLLAIALEIRPHFPLIDLIYHIPNGGSRGNNRRDAQIAGAKMKALGTKKGVPDLALPIPCQGYASLYIEMKKPKDGALSAEQMERILMLTQTQNFCAVIDDWRVGLQLIKDYLWAHHASVFKSKYAVHQIAANCAIFDPSSYYKVG